MFLTRQKQTYTNNVLEGISHDFLLPQKVGGEDLSEDFRIYNELSKPTIIDLVGKTNTTILWKISFLKKCEILLKICVHLCNFL